MDWIDTEEINDGVSSANEDDCYYSDEIDSDVEVALYSALHHEVHEENDNFTDSGTPEKHFNSSENSSNLNVSSKDTVELLTPPPSSFKSRNVEVVYENSPPNPNLYQSIKDKLKGSTAKNIKKQPNLSRKRKRSSSSDDSIVILDDSKDDISLPNLTNYEPVEDDSLMCISNPSSSVIYISDSSEASDIDNKELWRIDDSDRFSDLLSNQKRYYRRLMKVTCSNCQVRGHLAKNCPNPRKLQSCYLCGEQGHVGDYCSWAVCEYCQEVGHQKSHCYVENAKTFYCHLCHFKGHLAQDCPDLWRRYCLTTKPGPPVSGSNDINDRVYCYNCGNEGHFGHECEKNRFNNYSMPTSPYVICPLDADMPILTQLKVIHSTFKSANIKKLSQQYERKTSHVSQSNYSFSREMMRWGVRPMTASRNPFNQNSHIRFSDEQPIDRKNWRILFDQAEKVGPKKRRTKKRSDKKYKLEPCEPCKKKKQSKQQKCLDSANSTPQIKQKKPKKPSNEAEKVAKTKIKKKDAKSVNVKKDKVKNSNKKLPKKGERAKKNKDGKNLASKPKQNKEKKDLASKPKQNKEKKALASKPKKNKNKKDLASKPKKNKDKKNLPSKPKQNKEKTDLASKPNKNKEKTESTNKPMKSEISNELSAGPSSVKVEVKSEVLSVPVTVKVEVKQEIIEI